MAIEYIECFNSAPQSNAPNPYLISPIDFFLMNPADTNMVPWFDATVQGPDSSIYSQRSIGFGGYAMPGSNTNFDIRGYGLKLPSTSSTKVFHFWFQYTTNAVTNGEAAFFRWCTGYRNSNTLGFLSLDSQGRLCAYTGTPGAHAGFAGYTRTLAATGDTPLNPSRWYHIQLRVVINNSGSIEVKVDNNDYISWAGNTNVGSGANILSAILSGGQYLEWGYFSTFVVDTADFLGIVHQKTIYPNADGYLTDWSKSTGSTAYDLINETTTQSSETSYIFSSTDDQQQSVTFPNHALPSNRDIIAVQFTPFVRKISGGQLNMGIRKPEGAGGSNYMSTAQNPSATFKTMSYFWVLDPSTSAAWTQSGANDLEAIMETVI